MRARVAAVLAIAFLASGIACGKKDPFPAGKGPAGRGRAEDRKQSPASALPSGQERPAEVKMRAVIVPPSPSRILPPRISLETTRGQSCKVIQVRWKVEGTIAGEGESLSPANFRKGDTISAIVTVQTAEGTVSLETPAVTAGKSLPSVIDVRLEPTMVRTGSTVRAVVRGESPDGEPLTFRYKWYVDDLQVKGDSAELTLENVEKGAWVHVLVQSNDGISDGARKYSPKYRVFGPPPMVRMVGEPVITPEGVFVWTLSVTDAGTVPPSIELMSGPAGLMLSGFNIRWAVPVAAFGKESRFEVKVPEGDGAYSTHVLGVVPERK
jgi:hypothetical protein